MQTRASYNRFEMFVTHFLDHLVEKKEQRMLSISFDFMVFAYKEKPTQTTHR